MWVTIGAISAFLAVAMGAFGAHYLKETLNKVDVPPPNKEPLDRKGNYHTGAQYHMYHALAIVAVGLAAAPYASAAGWSFLVGTILFSGSLYLMGVTGIRWLGAITPFGGVGFMIGWALLAFGAWRK